MLQEVKMSKTVKGIVVNASYVPQVRCIMITLKEISSGRLLKPIALYEESFRFRPDQDIDQELMKTADLLRGYKHPITIAYDETKQ